MILFLVTTPTAASSARSKRDPSPSLRQTVLARQESNSNLNNKETKSKLERSSSVTRVVTRSNSQRDVTRSNSITRAREAASTASKRDPSPASSKVTIRRVPSIRDPSPSKVKTASETAKVIRRTGSKRDESPCIGTRTRLGLRNASPNTSNVSLKTAANKRLGRSDSLRNNSNPPSRSSSFNRTESRPSGLNRPGLATLPREAGHRSRSQGDYITVLEIGGQVGGTEARSKSASHHRSSTREASLTRTASRSSSFKKGGSVLESGGTVSVHIKHSQDVAGSHLLESRPAPARKQSIKIGREDSSTSLSSKKTAGTGLRRFVRSQLK